jgi:hypothetical protein
MWHQQGIITASNGGSWTARVPPGDRTFSDQDLRPPNGRMKTQIGAPEKSAPIL